MYLNLCLIILMKLYGINLIYKKKIDKNVINIILILCIISIIIVGLNNIILNCFVFKMMKCNKRCVFMDKCGKFFEIIIKNVFVCI